VPHTPSNRVQVYDRDWRFVRGWYVDAGGGTFTLRTSGSNQVEVITSRGQWHYTFDLQGKLLSKEHYTSGTYGSFRGQGESHTVPTAPWLWVFTSPGYSWLAAAAGMGLLAAANKFFRKQMPRPN